MIRSLRHRSSWNARLRSVGALVLLLVAVISSSAQSTERLDELSKQLTAHFQAGKLDLALQVAIEIRDLAGKIEGLDQEWVIKSHENVGAIYRAKDDCENAVPSFSKAIDLRRNIAPNVPANIMTIAQALGECQFKLAKFGESAETYRLAIAAAGSNEEKVLFTLFLNAASAEARAKNYVEADELYIRAYKILMNFYRPDDRALRSLHALRACNVGQFSENATLDKAYIAAQKVVNESNRQGIILGKAISLPHPPVSDLVRQGRRSGIVTVLVEIDEKGKVIDAESICSDRILAEASVPTARRAKFSPTTINGTPVATFGIVKFMFAL